MTTINPYASPSLADDPFLQASGETDPQPPYASQNKRFVNFIVDSVLTRMISLAGGFALGVVYAISLQASGRQFNPQDETRLNLMGMGIGILLLVAYFLVLEACFGWTLGKLITGTRVISTSGGKATFGQIIKRSLARLIPFEPFSFLFGDNTTGWHDSLSGTRVIDLRAARARQTKTSS